MFELLFKYPRQDYARSELVFTADWPAWLPWSLLLLAVVGIAWMLLSRRGNAAPTQLVAVGTLQLALVAVVLVVLLQPALQTEQLKPGENVVALVADSSASMAYGQGEPRLDSARDNLRAAIADSDVTSRFFSLSARAEAVDDLATLQAGGEATAIGESLIDIIGGARSQSLAAVILASDGVDTTGGISADQLAEVAAFGVPVHTIGVGRDRIPEDIELVQVVAPDKALPDSTITARLAIRHDAAGDARVRVYDGDELLATEVVTLADNVTMTTAPISLDLRDAGYHRLQFSVEGPGDEPELRNNEHSTLVKVEEQQFRVLYFEGEPRWEYKFLRRALDPEGDIRLATLLRVSPNKFYRQGLDSAEQLENGFPATRDELFVYDALIIGSVEAATLSEDQQQLIADFVSERGGSLLMLAGPNGLGNGGWGQSGIASLLPTRLPASTVDSFERIKAEVSLTPQGTDSAMLQLASGEENLDAWSQLPEVANYQATGDLKPAAISLLNVETSTGSQPLLVTQPYGRGHVYVLATGGTWRWQMSMPLEDLSHEMFWRQLLRALVGTAPPGISLSVNANHGDAAVGLRAEFRDDAFLPIDNIGVSAVVSHEDGSTFTVDMLPDPADAGVFTADAALDTSGSWYFEAIAERGGEALHVARASVYSESEQAEHFNLRRNAALLQRVSEATGGRYFDAGNLDGLADLLRYSSAGITEQILRPVWNAPAVFLLLLSLKFGEWLLRRRWRTI
ncbi:MAG: hypothetical protein QNJ23_09595 [Woeseiaceae bacterium]|nr:hypothetical protein [Woeseiaceae bacterium]